MAMRNHGTAYIESTKDVLQTTRRFSVKVKRALISVSDKTGLDEFARGLHALGVEILSTGGTAKAITHAGVPAIEVSEYTGFPEMLDGRVKTLHPKIHGGLLALRDNPEHMKTLEKHGIGLIDMVVVNLYPFEKTVVKEGVRFEEAIENIDIGGPSMLRSAAKNFKSVAVVCNPSRYPLIMKELNTNNGSLTEKTLGLLARDVFETTSRYDGAIHSYLKKVLPREREEVAFPDIVSARFSKMQDLRYGENPHQKAAFYRDGSVSEPSVSTAVQLHGKELSFNNIIDLNAALEIVKEFEGPAATIIKHTNPCGTAVATTLAKAYLDALDCDRLSAFGSIVGFNRVVDQRTAKAILKEADFVECIIAPGYEEKALAALKEKKNLRLLEVKNFGSMPEEFDKDMKKVVGGILVQDRDVVRIRPENLKVVTKRRPAKGEMKSLLFGWVVAKHVKSNAIVLSKGTATVGVGAGQMSRVDSVMIASKKAGGRAKGATLASDAFFPKEDGIKEAKKAGVSAIIQPGGSIRDEEVIKMADKLGLAMVFTGIRHFKH